MLWMITDKGDPIARKIIDGEGFGNIPHYSRQTPGSKSFTRNGQNLVFISTDRKAVWVTFRPTPGKAVRMDGLDAWECAAFCNRGSLLSSALIREAVLLSCALWGPIPPDGFITYVKPDAVKTELKGYCYRRAGWRRVGFSKDGKPMFKAPKPKTIPPWTEWQFSGNRGGRLRITMEMAESLRASIKRRRQAVITYQSR